LADNLIDIVKNLSRDQVNTMRMYGAKLNPIAMAYLMVAVIIPSLGITLLITVLTLPNVGGNISQATFWGILLLTLILQLQFAMIIKIRRPNLIGK